MKLSNLLLAVVFSAGSIFSQTGTIKGTLIDGGSNQPLIGANVLVMGSVLGAATDTEGRFIIEKVPAGGHTIRFSYIGYESKFKTDVIVKPGRITFLNEKLEPAELSSDSIIVSADYFDEDKTQPLSTASFSREEIRRAPGAAGDVSRILMSLPGLGKINDQSNSLIVRGGSPTENAFYIDNIEIPNINHFPTQGSSGGPISLINIEFINDVKFSSGGFSAAYGSRLSSIMELSQREGNRDEFNAQLDLNFSGFGGLAEGPLWNNKGSWMISARRSYLDLLIKAIDMGTSVAPRYGDYQFKFVYDINSNHKISLIGLFGDDASNSDKENAKDNDMIYYGRQKSTEGTTGITWRAVWGSSGYSLTSISYNHNGFDEQNNDVGSEEIMIVNKSTENNINFRNYNRIKFSDVFSGEFGFEIKNIFSDFDNYYAAYTDAGGNPVQSLTFKEKLNMTNSGAFINLILTPFTGFTAAAGLRADNYSYSNKAEISPRLQLSFKLSDKFSINAASGIYYQPYPLLLIAQTDAVKNLKTPSALHYIVGADYLLTESTKMSLEFYRKEYKNFPVDPLQPGMFMIDEIYYRYGFFFNHENLNDAGAAMSRGVEFVIQKKLAKDFYGLAGISFSKAEYKGIDNVWRNRVFDNGISISIEGGYKPNSEWEFSARWIYAGGAPYTPFNTEKSIQLNRAVLDESKINGERYPAYHSLNVRFDKRFHFSKSDLIFYLSIWNAYSRKNVASYFWNQFENRQDTIYQWTLLPIFGLEFDF